MEAPAPCACTMSVNSGSSDTSGVQEVSSARPGSSLPATQQTAGSESSPRTFSPPLDSVASVNFPEPLQMGDCSLGYCHQQCVD